MPQILLWGGLFFQSQARCLCHKHCCGVGFSLSHRQDACATNIVVGWAFLSVTGKMPVPQILLWGGLFFQSQARCLCHKYCFFQSQARCLCHKYCCGVGFSLSHRQDACATNIVSFSHRQDACATNTALPGVMRYNKNR